MKAILIFSLMMLVIPLAFFSPFTGLLSYLAVAYLRPHEWAYIPDSRISLAVALATLLGYLLFDLGRRLPRLIPNLLMVLLWLQLGLSTAFAQNSEYAQPKLVEFTKVILIALLMTALTDTEKRVRQLYLGTAIVMGLLAARSFARILVSAGQSRAFGPGGAFEDNNDYALLLVIVMPLIYYAAKAEKHWLWKLSLYTASFMTFTTIFFTRSRGGFLGVCVVSILLGLRAKHKVLGLLLAPLAIVAVIAIAPNVRERMSTIQGASQNDESAQQRLRVWAVSLKVIRDYPLTGAGLRNLMNVYGRYADQGDARVAHNSFLQMGSEAGAPALLLLVGMIALSYVRMWRARGILRQRAPDSPLIFYAHGLQVALVGYCVSGFFVSRHDLEMMYQICAMATAISLIALRYEREAQVKEDARPVNNVVEAPVLGMPEPVQVG